MSRIRFPRSAAATSFAAAALVATGVLAGCAPADAAPATTASVSAQDSAAGTSAVSDVESCEAFSDVLTILQNANVAVSEGRMSEKEFDGWMRLATRVLDRVPTNGTSEVSDAIEGLKEAAPAVPVGTVRHTDLGTQEWYSGAPPLAALCEAAGTLLAAEGFVGG